MHYNISEDRLVTKVNDLPADRGIPETSTVAVSCVATWFADCSPATVKRQLSNGLNCNRAIYQLLRLNLERYRALEK